MIIMSYCKNHILYHDSWSSKKDEIKCLNCHLTIINNYKHYYEVVIDGEGYKVSNVQQLLTDETNEEIPCRLTRYTTGYKVSHNELLLFLKYNDIKKD